MSKVWFVTGSSKGFGREFVLAALERGDKVAATARNTDALTDLVDKYGDAVLPLQLDVTDRDRVFAAVEEARDAFGRLDVVINNAGYGLFGTVEEISEQQLRDQLETNLFGVFHVTQAVLPILREQGSGHIIQISTIGGIGAFPSLGGYHASKWALEGLTESLAQEVAGFGIKVTLIEPGYYGTDFAGSSQKRAAANPAYDAFRAEVDAERKANYPAPGNPTATRKAVLQVVDADEPPLRIFFGDGPLALAAEEYESRLATWRAWEPVSIAAHG